PPPTSPLFPYTTLFRSAASASASWLPVFDEPDVGPRAARRRARRRGRGRDPGQPPARARAAAPSAADGCDPAAALRGAAAAPCRSEEHTSELQSPDHLV